MIVVFFDAGSRTAAAFRRSLGARTLRFVAASSRQITARDTATGSSWRLDGQAVAGALQGRALEPVNFHTGAWYAWAVYFPNTSIYRRPDSR